MKSDTDVENRQLINYPDKDKKWQLKLYAFNV